MKKQNKWKELATELRTSILEYWKFESDLRNQLKGKRVELALLAIQNLERYEAK